MMEQENEDQEILLKEIEELEWNSQAKECVEKSEQYISLYPGCKRVLPSYFHMYQFIDYKKATDMAKKLFDEDPLYFKNTYIYTYLLFDFDARKTKNIPIIYELCKNYNGDKDIYFYMTYAIAAKQMLKYQENLNILKEAVNLFEGRDRLEARLYHHISATVGSNSYLQKSIELQPNFDFNYLNLAISDKLTPEKAMLSLTKTLQINPLNHYAYSHIAQLKLNMGRHEEAREVYDKFFELNQYNPEHISQYLDWRQEYEKNKIQPLRQMISIEIIKKAYLYEGESKHNISIFSKFCSNINLYTDEQNVLSVVRDLLTFYMQNNIVGFISIVSQYKHIPYNSISILIEEAKQNFIYVLLFYANNRFLRQDISFQSNYMIWDLYFD